MIFGASSSGSIFRIFFERPYTILMQLYNNKFITENQIYEKRRMNYWLSHYSCQMNPLIVDKNKQEMSNAGFASGFYCCVQSK